MKELTVEESVSSIRAYRVSNRGIQTPASDDTIILRKQRAQSIEYTEFLNANNINSELNLLEIRINHPDFIQKWREYIIPRAIELYPFVTKFELSTLGDIVYSNGYYFFSIKVGWIDVDENKYLAHLKQRIEMKKANEVQSKLYEMNTIRALNLAADIEKIRSDHFNLIYLAQSRSPYKEMRVLLKKYNDNDLFDSYFFKIVEFCESELSKLRGK